MNNKKDNLIDTNHKKNLKNSTKNYSNKLIFTKLHILSMNVRTLRSEERLIELEHALQKVKWDVLGLCEVRRMEEKIEEREEYIFFHIGETKGHYGIGFLVKKHLKKNIKAFIGISERIAALKIDLPTLGITTIIQVHAPTEDSDKQKKENFYAKLQETIDTNIEKNIFVMGDFNAKIGPAVLEGDTIIGPYSQGVCNDNGEKMVHLARSNNLAIINTFYNRKLHRKWTWISPDGETTNEIDFFLCKNSEIINNFKVLNNFNFYSDHRLIRAEISLKHLSKHRRNYMSNTKVYGKQECTLINKELHQWKTEVNMHETKDIQEVQKSYNNFEEKLKSILNSLTREPAKEIENMPNNIKDWMEERRMLIQNRKKNRKQIAEISKKINRYTRKKKREHRTKFIQNYIESSGATKKAYRELDKKLQWIPKIQNKNKKLSSNRQEIISIATEFYENLYKSSQNHDEDIFLNRVEEPIPWILSKEVSNALSTQKNNKSPGEDGFTNEFLKSADPTISDILCILFNAILKSENVPMQWTHSIIKLLHKKGDPSDINNYRPISLTSNIYKIFSKIILKRIENRLDENQPVEQAGFRATFSTIDHIHTINQIIEKYNEYNKAIYMIFIDYSKAFDSLEHTEIWKALSEQGVPAKYINLIKNIYHNSTAKIKLESEGRRFNLSKGVKQGDPLSPKLFNAVLENVFRKLNWKKQGIKINGKYLNNLRFADDLVLFSESPITLEKMLNELLNESQKVGLEINTHKTKAMTNGIQKDIKANNTIIEYVEEYIYLGETVSMKDSMKKNVERRTTNAWKRYWMLKEVMKSKEMPIKCKQKVFDSCILPILTYGSQAWALTLNLEQKLAICQRAMERSMLHVKRIDRIRNETLRQETNIVDVQRRIRILKWKWAGHVCRQKGDRWAKVITEWYPRDGKRSRGRQRTRWSDEFVKMMGATWPRLTEDRATWKRLEEAFVQRAY